MTKLTCDGPEVFLHGNRNRSLWCNTPEQAAAIVLACEHFDDLLEAARRAYEWLECRNSNAATKALSDVLHAIDTEQTA